MAVAVASVSTVAVNTVGTVGSVAPSKPTGLTVGDLMVFYGAAYNAAANATFATLSGWTSSVTNSQIGNVFVSVQYKVADSADVAASSFTFSLANAGVAGGILFRITGYANAGLLNKATATAANTSSPTLANTVTPLTTNQLLLFLLAVNQPEAGETVSGYAIANSNPTWTEHFDSNNSGTAITMSAASAYRSSASATGNSSATLSGTGTTEDSLGVMISIPEIVNVSVSGSTGALTVAGAGGAVTGSANVSGSTGTLTLAGVGGTVDTSLPDWTPQTKHTSTWTNQPKS